MLFSKDKSINKYLHNYAEAESQDLTLKNLKYDYVVVIPVCNEAENFMQSVFENISEDVLVILVINAPNGKSSWIAQNHLLIKSLKESSNRNLEIHDNITHIQGNNTPDVLIINRNLGELLLDPKKGVGHARKIGCDIALKLYANGSIRFPWIFSTDADVILPENYFSQVKSIKQQYSAVVFDFKHHSNDEYLNHLQFLYDFKLRYYLSGLQFARNQYDYIPLGSTLVVNMQSYAQVRGFPKKSAGEDFYLLNKLAKVKPINYCNEGNRVLIQSRLSNRVPFGTGPALLQIKELDKFDDYMYYHPLCFFYLKKWQYYLNTLWENHQLNIKAPNDKYLYNLYLNFDCEKHFTNSSPQITSSLRWQQFIHQWFDAFRTLKCVHYFDKIFKRLNYKMLLKNDSFGKVSSSQLIKFIQTYDKI